MDLFAHTLALLQVNSHPHAWMPNPISVWTALELPGMKQMMRNQLPILFTFAFFRHIMFLNPLDAVTAAIAMTTSSKVGRCNRIQVFSCMAALYIPHKLQCCEDETITEYMTEHYTLRSWEAVN